MPRQTCKTFRRPTADGVPAKGSLSQALAIYGLRDRHLARASGGAASLAALLDALGICAITVTKPIAPWMEECIHLQHAVHRYRAMKARRGYPAEWPDTCCLYRSFARQVGGPDDFARRVGDVGVAPDPRRAALEAFFHRSQQQRLVQAAPAVSRNGVGVPEETRPRRGPSCRDQNRTARSEDRLRRR